MYERLTKTLALLSALLIVALQIAVHPDTTYTIRTIAALALIGGWLAAHFSRQSVHALWLFVAPLAPAALRAITGREGPVLDLIWMAGLTGTLLRSVSWTRWSFPAGWSVLLGGWALSLSLAWPVIVAREIDFDVRVLRDAGVINSWALLSAPQVVGWTLHVVLTQLLGLIWFDWVRARLVAEPDRMPRAVHAVWAAATIASLVAVYQGTVDLTFLSTPAWAALRRATGTMLDANAYGVTAAIAGPLAVLALRRHRSRFALSAGVVVLLLNLAGMWMSGSRTALVCAVGGVAGIVAGLTGSGGRLGSSAPSRRRLAPFAALVALAAVVLIATMGSAVGPLRRLFEAPGGSTGGVVSSLWNRGGYGTIAVEMVKRFPLGGVGPGGYHVIAPDYWRVMTDRQLPFDNAQNWWRHVAAEFGVLGGLPILCWSVVVAWLVLAGRAREGQRRTAIAVRGLIAGIGACSLLGMPTQTPVVLLGFFLLVAWLSVLVAEPDVVPLAARSRTAWRVVTVLAVAFAVVHLALARSSLSLEARAIRAHRDFVVGAYPPEALPGSGQFRWTREEARFTWAARTRWLVLRAWVDHPDVDRQPVRLTIETPCGMLLDRTLSDSRPVNLGIELPEGQQTLQAIVRVSRTWQPSRFGDRDRRQLGAAVVSDFVTTREVIQQQDGPSLTLPACDSPRF